MSGLRRDLARAQRTLDSLNSGAVIIDSYGDAWQESRGFWYRAFSSDDTASSWDLAQRAPVKVAHRPASS